MNIIANNDLFTPNPVTPQEKIRTAYNRAFVNWQAFWVEAYRDQSFYLNNQWTPEERRYLQQEQRPDYCYNLTRAMVNMVQGYQRKHRLSIVAQPVETADDNTADIATKLLYHVMRHGKGHYAVSDAFKGALVTGIGYLALELDFRNDPLNGDIQIKFYPWNTIITDPFWTQKDFSDMDYCIRRSYMDKQDACSKFPNKRTTIEAMQGNMRDDLFTFLPQQRIFQSQNLLAYTEYFEQKWKEKRIVINPFTLEEIEVTSKNKSLLEPLLDLPGVKSYTKQERTIEWMALLNNEEVARQENPFNMNEYCFLPVLAIYEPEYDLYQYKMQSLIRCVRDPQIEFNKRVSKITDFIDSQINSGWIVKKSRFDNPMDFYKTGQGRNIFAKDNADLMADARKLDPSPVPAGLFEMQNTFSQLVMRITGVNEELLGAASDDKAGILSMLRQGAGLVSLQDLFDNLRQTIEHLGTKIIKMAQNNYTPEKIERITGMKPTTKFYDPNFTEYDIVCVESALTETQQQLFFQQMMAFKEMGAPVPWKTILDAYPMQGATKLRNDIEQAEQQQMQMSQMQMQSEMQDKKTVNDLLIAEAKIKMAGAVEKLAKAQDDRAMMQEHKAETILKYAEAAQKIEGMSIDNIKKFIDTILALENAEEQKQLPNSEGIV